MSASYAHPEVLVNTDWVASHAQDANVRVVEVDVDTKAYDEGHVPGAIAWAWNTQLCDTVVRDILPKAAFEALLTQSGVGNETTVVLYGDNNNWFAAWAFWQMKIYGHQDVRIMDGGAKSGWRKGAIWRPRRLSRWRPSRRPARRLTRLVNRITRCGRFCRRCSRRRKRRAR